MAYRKLVSPVCLLMMLVVAGCDDAAGASSDDGGDAALDAAAGRDASPDSEVPDSGAEDAGLVLPETLAESGLYAEGSTVALAEGVMAFAPRYALWSDGAEKQRWLYLPNGTQIDSRDMDFWRFPVGTKAWKEFSRDGKKLETRLLWKTAQGWFMVAFAWNDTGTEAIAAPDGVSNALGTEHDIPARDDCGSCHKGQPDILLGASAIQLSHEAPGQTLAGLAADGALSDPPNGSFALPDTAEWNALGYMHANCGSCHNPTGMAYDRANMDTWLRTDALSDIENTPTYQSLVDVPLSDMQDDLTVRVVSGDPDQSGVILRMMTRGNEKAMPPIASEIPDETGLSLIRSWISAL